MHHPEEAGQNQGGRSRENQLCTDERGEHFVEVAGHFPQKIPLPTPSEGSNSPIGQAATVLEEEYGEDRNQQEPDCVLQRACDAGADLAAEALEGIAVAGDELLN